MEPGPDPPAEPALSHDPSRLHPGSWETGQDSQMPSLSTKYKAPAGSGLACGHPCGKGHLAGIQGLGL